MIAWFEIVGTFVNLYCPSSNSTHWPILTTQECPFWSTWCHLWGRYLPLSCCFTSPATLLALAPCWQTYHQKVYFSEWQMWSPQPTWTTPWLEVRTSCLLPTLLSFNPVKGPRPTTTFHRHIPWLSVISKKKYTRAVTWQLLGKGISGQIRSSLLKNTATSILTHCT